MQASRDLVQLLAGAISWGGSLGLSEVVALIMAGNAASRRVAEKIGLHPDGETQHAGLPHLVYKRSLRQ